MCFWCEFALFINVVGSVFFVVDLFCMNIFGGICGRHTVSNVNAFPAANAASRYNNWQT